MDPVALTDAVILALNEILALIALLRQSGVSDDQILAQAKAKTSENSVLYQTLMAHLAASA